LNVSRQIAIAAFVSFLAAGCSQPEFAGNSDQAVRTTKKPPKPPPTSIENPPADTPTNNELVVDDGGQINLPGDPVERVGVGFEDGVDADYNDLYICFQGHFNVDKRDIVSNRDQTVQATWGNISAHSHTATVTILDTDGKVLFTQVLAGRKRTQLMGTIPLTFKKGSKLKVMIAHNSTQHTNTTWAVVHKNQCNNTGI
jgi:hypothetical protein